MGLRLKLFLAIGLPILVIVTIICWSWETNRRVERSLIKAEEVHLALVLHAKTMQRSVIEVWQFMTDISATRGQDGLDDGLKEAAKSREVFLAELKGFKAIATAEQDDKRLALADSCGKAFSVYYDAGLVMAKAYIQDGTSAGNQHMKAFDDAAEKLAKSLDPLVEEEDKQLSAAFAGVKGSLQTFSRWVLVTGAFSILGGIVSLAIALRSINRPLQDAIGLLQAQSEALAHAATSVTHSSHVIAQKAQSQEASLEETSSALQQLSATTQRNIEGADRLDTLAKQARSTAEGANQEVEQMSVAMGAIKGSSNEIAHIVKSINEIAFQTNILALNAAVEAARAGEAGAGFAVVAEEVRNLARRSSEAATETSQKISKAIDISQHGVNYSEDVSKSLGDIVGEARDLDELSGAVRQASSEQSEGIVHITKAMHEIELATSANAQEAEANSKVAEELHDHAEQLRQSIESLRAITEGKRARPS